MKFPDNSLVVCIGEFYIVGTKHIDNMSELLQGLKINDEVILVNENNNPYDSQAVKVQTTDKVKLRYLSKNMNYIPLYMLDNAKSHRIQSASFMLLSDDVAIESIYDFDYSNIVEPIYLGKGLWLNIDS